MESGQTFTLMNSNPALEREMRMVNSCKGDLPGLDCPKCLNRGYIAEIQNGYVVMRECECMARRRSIYRMERSGLKKVIDKYTFSSYEAPESWQKKVKQKALEYLNFDRGWFYIGGQVGSGKSHICTAIAGELIKRNKSVIYMQWVSDVGRLKTLKLDEEYQSTIQNFQRAEVLYIDDFFKTEQGKNPTTADINIAFEILNYRYNNDSQTILSSEKTLRDLLNIDEAVASRIKEKAGDFALSINKDTVKNYRLKL